MNEIDDEKSYFFSIIQLIIELISLHLSEFYLGRKEVLDYGPPGVPFPPPYYRMLTYARLTPGMLLIIYQLE